MPPMSLDWRMIHIRQAREGATDVTITYIVKQFKIKGDCQDSEITRVSRQPMSGVASATEAIKDSWMMRSSIVDFQQIDMSGGQFKLLASVSINRLMTRSSSSSIQRHYS